MTAFTKKRLQSYKKQYFIYIVRESICEQQHSNCWKYHSKDCRLPSTRCTGQADTADATRHKQLGTTSVMQLVGNQVTEDIPNQGFATPTLF